MTAPGDMDSIDPLFFLLLWLPITYLSIFAHEVGHAVIGHLVGFKICSFGIGLGRPWALIRCGCTRIFLCRTHPLHGVTFSLPSQLFPPRRKMVPFLAGGIIANSLLTIFSWALWQSLPWGRSAWFAIGGINALLVIGNLLPYQIRVGRATIRNDAQAILAALRKRTASLPAPSIIQSVAMLRGLWESIGDELFLRASLLGSSAAWCSLADFERAASVYSEAKSLPMPDGPSFQARDAYIESAIATGLCRFDEALAANDAAEVHFRAAGDKNGLLCADIQRAQVKITQGNVTAAQADLEALTGHPLVKANVALEGELATLLLMAKMASSGTASLDEQLADYAARARKHPSSARDLQVYKALASLYAQNSDWVRAETAFRSALAAINAIASAWSDPIEKSRFLERQSSFFNEARQCFGVLSKSADAERLIPVVRSAEELAQQLADVPRLRHRRLFRAGLWVLLADFFCVVSLIVVAALLAERPIRFPLFVALFLFVVGTALGVLYLLFHATIGRFIPGLRYSGGAVILILSCWPWLSLVVLPMFYLIDRTP
jgi:hypothetical protein